MLNRSPTRNLLSGGSIYATKAPEAASQALLLDLGALAATRRRIKG